MDTASIFNIQRFSIHDGPGIRTTVFFKGCPLQCLWCANPESQQIKPEISINPRNCIGCGACESVCPQGAISFPEDTVCIDRNRCNACGACAGECYTNTIKQMGKKMTLDEVFQEIQKDSVFYANSGGGFTLSGGEPLLQGEFCLQLVEKCKRNNLHGAIETAGYGSTETLQSLASMLDVVFFDVKHMNDAAHKKYTGVSNAPILENLKAIQACAKEIVIRTPLVPGINDDLRNIEETAALCNTLKRVTTWEILPYHKLGEHKYRQLDRQYDLDGLEKPDKELLAELVETANKSMKKFGKQCVLNQSAI